MESRCSGSRPRGRARVFLSLWVALAATSSGLEAQSRKWTDLGLGTPGCCGVPILEGTNPRYGSMLTLTLRSAAQDAPAWLALGLNRVDLPLLNGVLVPNPEVIVPARTNPVSGSLSLRLPVPRAFVEIPVYVQALVLDPSSPSGFAFSNAITTVFRPHVPSDFNGDGISDHAIGSTGEDVGSIPNAGAVLAVYGGGALPSQILVQGQSLQGTLAGVPGDFDEYGTALASGDFDGDGYADLAIGSPRDDSSGGIAEVGTVHVIYGSPQGLQAGAVGRDDQLFEQGTSALAGSPEEYDWFGYALTAGDFDGDGWDDLAVGVPFENEFETDQGVVQVLFGSANGLTTLGNLWLRDPEDIAAGDRFGWALVAADFDGNGRDELAVGMPYDDPNGQANAGSVVILEPGRSGHAYLRQGGNVGGFPVFGTAEASDQFGWSLAAGDFNGDFHADLAVGVPWENIGTEANAGSVHVFRGGATGITGFGDQIWDQNSPGVLEVVEANDQFGFALAAGDFDGDGRCDLAIGVPREVIGGTRHGIVQILRGAPGTILTSDGNGYLHPDLPGVLGVAESNEEFGRSLFASHQDGDGILDLTVGIPGDLVGTSAGAGSIQLFRGSPSGITVFGNTVLNQGNLPGAVEAGDRLGGSLVGSPDAYVP